MRRLLISLLASGLVLSLTISTPSAHALHTVEKRAAAAALSSPGLLVMSEDDMKVLVENKPDSTRVPASVLKLITTTAALQYLGADTRYTTTIWKTANQDEYLIRGTLDPFLTSSKYISDKFGNRFLPTLINKANISGAKRIRIYYEGLYPKDVEDLTAWFKAQKFKVVLEKVTSAKAIEVGTEEVSTLTSPPLSKIISHTITWSDNRVADRLANAVARFVGNPTTTAGLTKTYKDVLSSFNITSEGLQIHDGSGLSKENRVSARTIVELLIVIRKEPRFLPIYDGMPVAGESGTLEKRFEKAPGAIGKVRAKTGWVNSSVTLAGFVTSGEAEYAFAILADGIQPTFKARNAARRAMDKMLETIVMGDH